MIPDLGSQTVTVVRGPGLDWQGDPLPDPPVEVDVAGCMVQPRTTNEQTDQRDTVRTGLTAWLPAGTDIRATDRVRYAGELHHVDGNPFRWVDFGGVEHHVEVDLRRVEG